MKFGMRKKWLVILQTYSKVKPKGSIISRVYRDQAPLQTTSVLLKKTKFAIWAYLLGQMSVMQGKKKRKGEELIDRPDRREHENQTA